MYICNDCERTFSECGTYEEHHPYGMGSAYETWYLCPRCDSAGVEEAKECERCGEYFVSLTDGLCDLCYEEMYE